MKKTNSSKTPKISYTMLEKRLVDKYGKVAAARRVSAFKRIPWSPVLGQPAFELDPDEDDAPPRRRQARPAAVSAIVGAAFDAAVPKEIRRKLEHGQALAAIVLVPSPEWVGPVTHYFTSIFGNRWVVQQRDGSNRRHDASYGSADVSHDLSRGRCVVGIAADEDLLPSSLVGAADIKIRLSAPDAPVMATAIKRFARKAPPILPEDIAGLDLHQLVAAFRPGTGAAKIVQRLSATSAALRGEVQNERVPDLETAVEYGEARIWALNLARDVADYRRGACDWASLPKGVCLASEPGCGKSVLARSIARFCGDAPIVISSVADWFTKERSYMDDVIRAMRSTLDRSAALARAHGICFLFLDEVDAIPDRATLDSRNKDYWLPIVADLLTRLDDGTSSVRRGVILIAATNNPSAVDPALLRPGRFERLITIDRADAAGTLNMLKFHVAGAVPDGDLEDIAIAMERSTGAEVMAFVREARRIARHAGRDLSAADLRAALMGADRPAPEVDWRICAHEAGHAVLSLALDCGRLRHCVVGAKTGAENRTLVEYPSSPDLVTRQTVEDRVTMLLGGRAAERILFGCNSAGGAGDESADTGLAFSNIASLHLSWGLGEIVSFHGSRREVLEAARCDRSLRDIVEADLQRLQKRAEDLVRRHRAALLAVAEALRERRYLGGDEVRALFEARRPKAPRKKEGRACSS
ncbi:AAA family ATPase [Bradyrhizobium iriomotense]|uniref:AAA family ATPase n=1 Tax=Bradyrhizobium iriomotense TaxID=441950 RepID=UPI001B8A11EC|nr:AAA family ATPase [Bradyrhizobium iriomotense]MBR0780751.1 AAA family ATPase [Bradyrhizobium iriomotense]